MRLTSQDRKNGPRIIHGQVEHPAVWSKTYGTGSICAPEIIRVGEYITVICTFEIGTIPVETGGEFFIAWRWPYDWADLQNEDPHEEGFVTVQTENQHGEGHIAVQTENQRGEGHVAVQDAVKAPRQTRRSRFNESAPVILSTTYERMGGIEPWHHQLRITVDGGHLVEGDRVIVRCGDTSSGGAGWRAATCASDDFTFLMLIDHNGNGDRVRLHDPPVLPLKSGAAAGYRAIIPSNARVGAETPIIVRCEDEYGNPTAMPKDVKDNLILRCEDDDGNASEQAIEVIESVAGLETIDSAPADAPHPETPYAPTNDTPPNVTVRLVKPGTYRFRLEAADSKLLARSNPITVHSSLPRYRLFWGDLHGGQTRIGCGRGSLDEFYRYARRTAGLQFVTHQANDHFVTHEEWKELQAAAASHYTPGEFVTYLGYEWSPQTVRGGDRNVVYAEDTGEIYRSTIYVTETDPDNTPLAEDTDSFFKLLASKKVLVNLHVGGRVANLERHEPAFERLAEIHSAHGTSEWFFNEALERGYQFGITAGTDGVTGKPGAYRPGNRFLRNVPAGLTGVYAQELTREALWEAFMERQCYGTTGERIIVWVEVNGYPMGSSISIESVPRISLSVEGTKPIERVDILRGTEIIHSWSAGPDESASDKSRLLRFLWGGTEKKGPAPAQRVRWDGRAVITAGDCGAAGDRAPAAMELVEPIGFFTNEEFIRQESSSTIVWKSVTAGNACGFIAKITGCESARIEFATPVTSFSVASGEVHTTPLFKDAGGVNRFVRIGPPPHKNAPMSIELTYDDTTLSDRSWTGAIPYWIKVTQIDQSLAWSTPVYVNYRPG